MPTLKRIVIIAGEESGDAHAAHLVHELLKNNPDLQFSGIGGDHLEEAGMELVHDLARYGATGLTAVVRHTATIYKAFKVIKQHLKEVKPDLLVLVDCPSFNLRIAKYAKEVLNLRIVYYISPQIWAWKANRIHTIRQYIDRMAVILPFEKKIYEQAKVPVSFVGHPLVGKIPLYSDLHQLRLQLTLPVDKKIVALLPGSRRNEIEHHLPVMVETAKQLSLAVANVHFVIPVARTIQLGMVEHYFKNSDLSLTLVKEQAIEVAACSDCVVVASGTASLECALLLRPMCIVYKVSLLTYLIASRVIKVRYLGLCNLLQNKMIVPEFLQYDCNAPELLITLKELLSNPQQSKLMQDRLLLLKQSLSAEEADCSIAEVVEQELALV